MNEMNAVDVSYLEYIKPIRGAVCGPHDSRQLYYRNTHPSTTLAITIDHWWLYEGRVVRDTRRTLTLAPNPRGNLHMVDPGDASMGCPIPGPTMQQFHWDVLSAVPA